MATMAEATLLEQIRKVIREEVEAEGKKLAREQSTTRVMLEGRLIKFEDRMKDLEISHSRIEKGRETLELKIESVHEFNKKAHDEIMDKVAESNELNGKQVKELENRVTQLEADSQFPKSH